MAAPAAAFVFDAFEALPDPAAILAPDGALVRANPAFRAAFRHHIGPSRAPWGRFEPPRFEAGLRRFNAPAPDGRRFEWVELLLADGARLAVARDISRHVNAAEDAARAKTTLFATLTHELRTPLNGILGMAGLLAEAKLEPAARTYVAAIRESGELLLEIITEILDYARLEAGRVELEAAPFDPEAAMQSVAELLSPKARAKGLEIAVAVRAGAPTRAVGDDGRLRQILFNLAGNAVKFTATGGVLLELAPSVGGRLRFAVHDTGPGVAPEMQAQIFEEFAQGDASVSRRHGGAGLGLAIVRKLARAMGGEAGLVSKAGEGASFWVELPLAAAPEAPAQIALPGVRVCVLSSSAILIQAARINIVGLGAIVVGRDERPDIILVDWTGDLPPRQLGALQRDARALIALIAQEERGAIAQCRAAGLAHYTLKPVRRRSLAERIRAALGEAPALAPELEPPLPQLRGLRVLLAEDNPINALLARTLLARAGCAVDVVGDGEEAVAAAAAASYDLILLDLRMPRLDGYGAAERIRGLDGPAAHAPIVALTADAGEAERVRALASGMDDFLTKPIDQERLYAVAARFTGRAKAASLSTSS